MQPRATTPSCKTKIELINGPAQHTRHDRKKKTYETVIGAASTLPAARLVAAVDGLASDAHEAVERAREDTEGGKDGCNERTVRLEAYI